MTIPDSGTADDTARTAAGDPDQLGVRVAAAVIDLVVLAVVVIALLTVGFAVGARGEVSLLTFIIVAFIVWPLAYYMGLEATTGRTVGKLLLGLRVVDRFGGRPSPGAVAIRTVVRLIDFLPAWYLVGFLAMLATGTRRLRLGDLAARTSVERAAPIRRRGLAAAALGSSLLVLLVLSWVSALLWNGGLSGLGGWSSACVGQRCNATARGAQVLDLNGRDVRVSDVGEASATFTIDGETVTIGVGETRQVADTLVYLAAVEGGAARFSVDLSGLFVERADLDAGDGQRDVSSADAGPYLIYDAVTDDQGIITVEVPAAWDDVDGRENIDFGPSLSAAPDLGAFSDTWDAPGILVSFSMRHGANEIDRTLERIGLSDACTGTGAETYDDPPFRGRIERWTDCGGTPTAVVTAVLTPADGSGLVRVVGQALGARDLAAIERALETLEISSIDPGAEGVATDAGWLERVTSLRESIEDEFWGFGPDLTPPVMRDMAEVLRRCSDDLSAIGAPGDALEQAHALAERACARYDKGAGCFEDAAEIGIPEAGTGAVRRQDEALDCGFDAVNAGSELLVEAELEATGVEPPR